jgi:hypothetical protein
MLKDESKCSGEGEEGVHVWDRVEVVGAVSGEVEKGGQMGRGFGS